MLLLSKIFIYFLNLKIILQDLNLTILIDGLTHPWLGEIDHMKKHRLTLIHDSFGKMKKRFDQFLF